MATLLIAYDLVDRDTESSLTAAIRRLGNRWARPLPQLWCVETDKAAEVVEAELSPMLGMDGGLMVQQLAGEAATSNTMVRWTRSLPPRGADEETALNIVKWPGHSSKVAEAA